MSEMVISIKWDGDNLGPMWMNLDNLELMLFGNYNTKRSLVQVEELSHSDRPDSSTSGRATASEKS